MRRSWTSRRSGPRGAVSAVLGLLACSTASEASASNGATPRTPPFFPLEECLSVVDRTVDSTFVVDFSIPIEDDILTPDELPDSRRFQFFALCRDNQSLIQPLPNWITVDDAERALAAGIIPEMPPAEDMIPSHPDWSACVLPINLSDDRIPITCEDTEGGVAWDASAVPAGNYVVRGYNFEPALNLWRERRGVVQVNDGETLPVVSLMSPAARDRTVYENDGYRVEGCMGGPEGTQVQLSWARLIDLAQDEPSDWTVFAELDAADGSFSVLWEPPPEAVNQAVVFRGQVGAPGAEWTSHAIGSVIVFPGDGTSDGPEAPPVLDHCDFYPEDPAGGSTGNDTGSTTDAPTTDSATAGSDSTTGTDPDTDDGSMTAGGASEPDDGCGCRVPRDGPMGPQGLFLALAALGLRRRR